jgi:hypothetical protein
MIANSEYYCAIVYANALSHRGGLTYLKKCGKIWCLYNRDNRQAEKFAASHKGELCSGCDTTTDFQARVLLAWLDQYGDEMFQTVHPKVKQGIEEPKTIKRCDYCHKEVDQLYDLTPADMGEIATVHVCKECHDRVAHELEQGGYDLDL